MGISLVSPYSVALTPCALVPGVLIFKVRIGCLVPNLIISKVIFRRPKEIEFPEFFCYSTLKTKGSGETEGAL